MELQVDLGSVGEFRWEFVAAFPKLFEWDAGVDAEAGLGGGIYVEEVGNGGSENSAVEDLGVAEDVHEQSVGAIGGVQFHPLPIFTSTGAARGGVGFGETAKPDGVGADLFIGGCVEVAVSAMFIAAEDDCGFGAGGEIVKEVVGAGEIVGSCAEVAAKQGGRP